MEFNKIQNITRIQPVFRIKLSVVDHPIIMHITVLRSLMHAQAESPGCVLVIHYVSGLDSWQLPYKTAVCSFRLANC